MEALRSEVRTSLYREVAQTLLRRIRAGQYAAGTLLPREVDLSTEFGVSRATVREALRLMEMEHAIIRRRRLGTIVSGIDPSTARHLDFDLPLSLEELTRDTRLVLFAKKRRAVPDGLADEMGPTQPPTWLYFAGVRRSQSEDQPLSITEIYLHPRLVAVANQVGTRAGLVYRLLEQECGERIRQVKTRVEPHQLTAPEADHLQLPSGSLATRMVQRIFNEGCELLEVAIGLYPASRFVFETSFALP